MAPFEPSMAPLAFKPPIPRLAFIRAAFGFILAALCGGGMGGRRREVAASWKVGATAYKGLVLSLSGIELLFVPVPRSISSKR